MSEYPFRKKPPKRTYTGKVLNDYKRYKPHLEKDFNERCGYTDCAQDWFGGHKTFQIDHFKPRIKYPELESIYSNLVYSCSYVNRAKSDDLNTYYDPVDIDYNDHFYRDHLGYIYPRAESAIARYMYKQLKLYLKRYSIIWMLEALEEKMEILRSIIEQTNDEEAKKLFFDVTFKFMDYKRYLKAVR